MLKRHTFWSSCLLLTGAFHSISLFAGLTPQNETERQMLGLMASYKLELGPGFHPTMGNLFTALSSCFTFLSFLSGLTIAFLLKKRVAPDILQGVVVINLLIIGACFIVDLIFTFLIPVGFVGLCVVLLAVGLLTIPGASARRAGAGV